MILSPVERKYFDNLKHAGTFSAADNNKSQILSAQVGEVKLGRALLLQFAIKDGYIFDCKFQAFGPARLLTAAECLCVHLKGLKVADARQWDVQQVASELSFPSVWQHIIHFVSSARDKALDI